MNEATKDAEKLLGTIGLCKKAGKLIVGVPMICDALRRGGKDVPVVVLEAGDTSENTHKRISDKCAFYGVEQIRLDCDGATLSRALGKGAPLAAVAITDRGMYEMVKKHLAT